MSTTPVEGSGRETIDLPEPRLIGGMPLVEALARRRSVREFGVAPLALAELSQLCWAAQGVTSPWGTRAAPSAGALYPLELHAATEDGLFRYLPGDHRLEVRSRADVRPALARASGDQRAVAAAQAVFALAAVLARSAERYGARAQLYAELEAGHAAQNLLLQGVALGLGSLPVGAFDPDAVREALAVPADHTVLYLVCVGRTADPW